MLREEGPTGTPQLQGSPGCTCHIQRDVDDAALPLCWVESCKEKLWLQNPETEGLRVRVAVRDMVAAQEEDELCWLNGAKDHQG